MHRFSEQGFTGNDQVDIHCGAEGHGVPGAHWRAPRAVSGSTVKTMAV